MRTADIISAAILLALALVAGAGTLDLPYWSEFSPGPAFAARWIALVAAVLAALLMWEALTRTEHAAIEWPDREGVRRVGLACVLLWAFVAALPWLGFTLDATALMLALLLLVQRRPLAPSLLTTAITVAGAWGIFIAWLQIKLPVGVLGV